MRRAACIATLILAAALATPAGIAAREGAAAGGAEAESLGDQEFARDNYEAAEARYREALAARPGSVHALSRLALLLTWKGEYKEAISLYRKAIALDPSRFEARRGLATAYTWSEDYHSALSLYRELLGERPGDEGLTFEMAQAQAWSGDLAAASRTLHELVARSPRHIKGRLLLGQVHAWSGEPAEAEKIYRSILAEEPGNLEALAGLAGAQADQGRLEEALATYARVLAADPKNRAALEGRARVLHWQGRTSEALVAVRDALELYPDARDARRLGRDIGGALRPSLQLYGTTSQDSDDNDVATWGAIYTHYLGGKGYAGFTYTHAQTDVTVDDPNDAPGASLPPATPVARYDSVRVTGGRHFSQHFSLYGEAGSERTEVPLDIFGANERESRSHPAGSITFEVNAGGWLTLVGSVSQDRLVGTTQAFMNDVGIGAGTLTAHFSPHPRLRLRLTGQKAKFTDDDDLDVGSDFLVVSDTGEDNERDLAAGGAAWRVPLQRPRLFLNYNLRWMSYDHDLDQGYFDPDHFVSHTAGFDISDSIGRSLYWGGGIDAGIQRINDGDEDNVLSYRLLAGVNIAQSASIEAYYSRSELALAAAAGFKSTEAGLRMRFRFGQELGPAAPGRGVSGSESGTGQ